MKCRTNELDMDISRIGGNMSNNLEFMKEHNCKHLKNCKFASVVKYQYSDDKKGWYIQFGNVLHGIKYCPYCGMRLEDENER